jgi:glycosyltransferase involved in cell wall biosynthesis
MHDVPMHSVASLAPSRSDPIRSMGRVRADGRFLVLDGEPFRVTGVTYGTFSPRLDGALYPEPSVVKLDLSAMAAAGINVVRTYTVPPPDLLDVAGEAGLRVLVGLHYDDWRAEPHVGRAAHRRVTDRGRRAVEAAMTVLAGNPGVLAVSVGNEVPGDVVRLHGVEAVQETLGRIVRDVHAADPEMLVTYTNYPTTEYLRVRGEDLVTFNVFLEDPRALRAYLARLQRQVDVPVVVSELGLAAGVHGAAAQAESLRRQLEVIDRSGCAGATVFSWTDEWAVAGRPVEGWDFGITDAQGRAKPAFDVVRRWAGSSIDAARPDWPTVSVVVCAYREERRLAACLDSLQASRYPRLEVIVCDDGSDDATLEVARRYPFRVLALPHAGLSVARNAGLAAATGAIVAYLDADATCHPEWPYHLALSLEDRSVDATGGPNLPAVDAGLVERAVAASPGGPAEVLVADERAEHVPGCNMAFRREVLEDLGGFDPIFTSAGDDVDVCWRLLDTGRRIAFTTAAQIRHHRRDTVRGYLRQQRGYGRAERLVAGRHAHRFNRWGQAMWAGSIYGGGVRPRLFRPLIYHGSMGLAPFQGRLRTRSERGLSAAAPFVPLVFLGAIVAALVAAIAPAAWFVSVACLAALALYAGTVAATCVPSGTEPRPLAFRALVALLHVLQPVVRLWGRITGPSLPRRQTEPVAWRGDRQAWLTSLVRELARGGAHVVAGRPTDRFDLSVTVGPSMVMRVTTAVVWGWTPTWAATLRPRVRLLVALGTATALGVWLDPRWAILVAAGLVLATVEAVVLRRRLARAIASTTEA